MFAKLKILMKPLASLRLTIALLVLSMALVFFGTLDQVHQGIRVVQARYFESFFVVWQPEPWKRHDFLRFIMLPLPGGYLVGGLLLVNLLAAHTARFRLTWKKSGIFLIHVGLIVLLLSQLWTQLASRESQMTIEEGSHTWFSEDYFKNELALIRQTGPDELTQAVIPAERLRSSQPIRDEALPVIIEPVAFYLNSIIAPARAYPGARVPVNFATAGVGVNRDLRVLARPRTYAPNEINTVSAYIRLRNKRDGNSLGTYLVSNVLNEPENRQTIEIDGESWELALRYKRHYHDFALALDDFRFDRYPGTEIPRNFSSDVRIIEPGMAGDGRDFKIFMNNPLRHGGLTFYQASFDEATEQATVLQVVRNPGWTLPYVAVALIGSGMTLQFSMHLFKFLKRRSSDNPGASKR